MVSVKMMKLLELINELVNEEGLPWREKREALLREASDDDKTNLAEFAGWFEE